MCLKHLMIVFLIISGASCSKPTKPRTVSTPSEIAKVTVSADGKIYFNQRVETIDELRSEFQKLKSAHGAVWFVDQSSSGPSWQQGQTVKKAIIDAQLPMKMQ